MADHNNQSEGENFSSGLEEDSEREKDTPVKKEFRKKYIRRRFTHTQLGKMVRRETSSVSVARQSPRENGRKTNMLWMYTKLQEYEELKVVH